MLTLKNLLPLAFDFQTVKGETPTNKATSSPAFTELLIYARANGAHTAIGFQNLNDQQWAARFIFASDAQARECEQAFGLDWGHLHVSTVSGCRLDVEDPALRPKSGNTGEGRTLAERDFAGFKQRGWIARGMTWEQFTSPEHDRKQRDILSQCWQRLYAEAESERVRIATPPPHIERDRIKSEADGISAREASSAKMRAVAIAIGIAQKLCEGMKPSPLKQRQDAIASARKALGMWEKQLRALNDIPAFQKLYGDFDLFTQQVDALENKHAR